MSESRQTNIELLAGKGKLDELRKLLGSNPSQFELDLALENAIAYSRLDVADYLISLNANLSHYDNNGTYYAVQNNELEGLKYAVAKGVDINIRNGMPLSTSIMTATYQKDLTIIKWLIKNDVDLSLLSENSKRVISLPGNEDLRQLIKYAT